jgi:hypothetical protein
VKMVDSIQIYLIVKTKLPLFFCRNV